MQRVTIRSNRSRSFNFVQLRVLKQKSSWRRKFLKMTQPVVGYSFGRLPSWRWNHKTKSTKHTQVHCSFPPFSHCFLAKIVDLTRCKNSRSTYSRNNRVSSRNYRCWSLFSMLVCGRDGLFLCPWERVGMCEDRKDFCSSFFLCFFVLLSLTTVYHFRSLCLSICLYVCLLNFLSARLFVFCLFCLPVCRFCV